MSLRLHRLIVIIQLETSSDNSNQENSKPSIPATTPSFNVLLLLLGFSTLIFISSKKK